MIRDRARLGWRQAALLLATFLFFFSLTEPVVAQSAITDLVTPAQTEDPAAGEADTATSADDPVDTTDADAVDRSLWQADPDAVDYETWDTVATRAEQLLLRNQAQTFALERLRSEISQWRDVFAAAVSENDERLITIDEQIAALGPAPTDGSEATMIAARRADLIEKRDLLAAPGLLAAEANAHAAGLSREIEAQVTERQTEDLLERHATPLNPTSWSGAIGTLWGGIGTLVGEMSTGLSRVMQATNTASRLLVAALSIAAALWLFVRGRRFARRLFCPLNGEVSRLLFEFMRTMAEAALPLLGLVALTYGLAQVDLFGPLGESILNTVPLTGSLIILTGWLTRQFFPLEPNRYGPLALADHVRLQARRLGLALAWLAALWLPYDTFLNDTQADAATIAVLSFPVIVVISLVLFRFATILRSPPSDDAGPNVSQGRTRSVIGRLAQAVAIAAPLLAAAGYDAAADAILYPMILSLGVLGTVVYLQAVAYQTHELIAGDQDNRPYALVPVLIGLALLLISAPVLALIWGAQRADLVEYWTRFTEGLSFGETTVSPSDFIWFVIIFTVGYLLTQFVKNTLRASVLPRTRLDLGAQNAIVSGFGYIGIFLAAVVAITSAGIDLSNLAIVAGALSVGIGFGLQTIVSNFVSGIILLIERPISEGDWIEVGGKMGYVRDISVRSTRIETFDQTDVIVPNADLVSNQVINWTRGNLVGRLILKIGVAYGSDVDKVMEILKEVAESHPMVVMSPPPGILFMNFGADALEFEIRAILRDVNFILAVQSEMNLSLAQRFEEAGIEIPFAQRDIWLRNPEVLGHAGPAARQQTEGATAKTPDGPRHREGPDTTTNDPQTDGDST